MVAVSLEFLKKAAAPKVKLVELGELAEGAQVYVKEMSAGERDDFWRTTRATKEGEAPDNLHARLVALTLVDENGVRLAPGDDGYKQIRDLSAKVVTKLFDVATSMNKLSEEEAKEAEKNSEKTQSEDSTSA